ncbi:MAG: hypothetical protein ACKVZJ_15985 [Phycisphaerales bacterium]
MTLLELLLALSITVLTGAAAAAITLAVARSLTSMNDSRSVTNRANLVQARLRGVTDTASCVLETNLDKGVAVWAGDDNPNGRVNISELRIIWFNKAEARVTTERVQWPAGFTPEVITANDLVLAAADDPFGAIEAQRALGRTVTQIIGDRLTVSAIDADDKTTIDAHRFRVFSTIISDAGEPVELLTCLALPDYAKPQ